MTFFKVKPEHDQVKIKANHILVANELYTLTELGSFPIHSAEYFDMMEISKKDTYWFFGARFSKQFPYNSK